MTLPAFWWLLLPASVGHGVFFVAAGALRLQKKRLQDAPWTLAVFGASAIAGLCYGIVQRDPVFIVAEMALISIVFSIWRTR